MFKGSSPLNAQDEFTIFTTSEAQVNIGAGVLAYNGRQAGQADAGLVASTISGPATDNTYVAITCYRNDQPTLIAQWPAFITTDAISDYIALQIMENDPVANGPLDPSFSGAFGGTNACARIYISGTTSEIPLTITAPFSANTSNAAYTIAMGISGNTMLAYGYANGTWTQFGSANIAGYFTEGELDTYVAGALGVNDISAGGAGVSAFSWGPLSDLTNPSGALPSTPPLTLLEIQSTFGGPGNLLSYNRGGLYVPDTRGNANVPVAAPIEMVEFLGAGAPVEYLFIDTLTDLNIPLWQDYAANTISPHSWSNVNGVVTVSTPQIQTGMTSLQLTPNTNMRVNTNINANTTNTTITMAVFLEANANLDIIFGTDINASATYGMLLRLSNVAVNKMYNTGGWYGQGTTLSAVGQITSNVWHIIQLSMEQPNYIDYSVDGVQQIYFGNYVWKPQGTWLGLSCDAGSGANAYVSKISVGQPFDDINGSTTVTSPILAPSVTSIYVPSGGGAYANLANANIAITLAGTNIDFDFFANTGGIFDFMFGAKSDGTDGTTLRLDARIANFSGFSTAFSGFYVHPGSGDFIGPQVVPNQWHHYTIKIAANGTYAQYFVDGVLGTDSTTSSSPGVNLGGPYIALYGDAGGISGYFSNLVVTAP